MTGNGVREEEDRGAVSARVCDALTRALAQPFAPGLYLVATPIGNLADMTLRGISVLAQADVIFAEDTRFSSRLLSHFGISTPMRAYHDHSRDRERTSVLAALAEGQVVALISDAGTPLVSDPGFKLVRAAIAEDYRVYAIPGPSAALAALSCSGLPTDTFLFAGFPPAKPGARRTRIAGLRDVAATLIFFEGPSRVGALLSDLSTTLGPREAVVARELTKLHEEVARGTLDALAERFVDAAPKGECVVVVAPPAETRVSDDDILEQVRISLDSMSLRDASRFVASQMNVAKARVYEIGLKLKNSGK